MEHSQLILGGRINIYLGLQQNFSLSTSRFLYRPVYIIPFSFSWDSERPVISKIGHNSNPLAFINWASYRALSSLPFSIPLSIPFSIPLSSILSNTVINSSPTSR